MEIVIPSVRSLSYTLQPIVNKLHEQNIQITDELQIMRRKSTQAILIIELAGLCGACNKNVFLAIYVE
jgi:F0F1-type ATP synthase gamma subunit